MLEIEVGNAHSQITDTLETNNKVPQLVNNDFEIFPILSYDTDTGFGYGLKSFFLNFLGINESFDLILFNSTKGKGGTVLSFQSRILNLDREKYIHTLWI